MASHPWPHWACLVIAAWAAFSWSTAAALVPTGLNLPSLDIVGPHYGGTWASANSLVFLDLFKHSTQFVGQGRAKGSANDWAFAPGEHFSWTPDGYPTTLEPPLKPSYQEYSTYATVGVPKPFYPAGKYLLLYDGTGTVTLSGDAAATGAAKVTVKKPRAGVTGNVTSGQIGVAVTPSAGFTVRITRTDPSDPIRNIRVLPSSKRKVLRTYTSQSFHPKFMELVTGFSILRFTNWQKVKGDERHPSMLPRTWEARVRPDAQCQTGQYGMAVEYMVQLANTAAASPWLSLPGAANDSDSYHLGLSRYVLDYLDPGLNVYIEFGSGGPGWMTSILADNTVRISKIWRSVWSSPANSKRLVVVAAYTNPTTMPYFQNTFGANHVWVDAIGTMGAYGSIRGWNAPTPCYFEFNSPKFTEDTRNFNVTLERVTNLARSSVIHADLVHNRWAAQMAAMGKTLIGIAGGPDGNMQAPYYASRMNYASALACTSFPCTKNLYPPASPSGAVTWQSAGDRDAAVAVIRGQAQREYDLEELLMQLKLREPITKEHVLDHLWRWEAAGGGPMVVDLPSASKCTDGPGTRVMVPVECQPTSPLPSIASPATSPVYQAVRSYQRGGKSTLPRTATPPPQPQPCRGCAMGTCIKGRCVCWAGYSGPTCNATSSRPNECNSLVGVNLEGLADWSRSWTFVDVMKTGRAWIGQTLDGGGGWGNTSVDTDASGWVRRLSPFQMAGTMMIRDLQGHVPGGTYLVTYEGEGIIDFSMDVAQTRQISAGLVEVDLTPSTGGNNGLFLTVTRTNPDNPVRNIKALMPGFDPAQEAAFPFHPSLITFLKPFGTIRFMDWMHTNAGRLPVTWADRPKTTDRSYAANLGGVALEHMILLANTVGAAPWFNMPHTADDDYHLQFATMVKDRLRPDVKVYVEWSNEVWHTGFPGGQFAQSEGVRLNMTEEGARWYGGATNEARLCYYSERTKNMSRIWRGAFGDQAAARLVVVAQGQGVWAITSDKVLKCRNATSFIDALAVGPYFGEFSAARDADLATFMNVTLPKAINDTMNYVMQHVPIAAKYGKPVMAYESGYGVAADHPTAMQAARDGGMYRLYRQYMSRLRSEAGMTHISHYSSIGAYSKYGSWGLMEWGDQEPSTAPKLMAVTDFITDVACNGSGTGGAPDPVPCPNNCSGHGSCWNGACSCFSGYYGKDCNGSSFTDYSSCGYYCTFYQGECQVVNVTGLTRYLACKCSPGFSGIECSRFTCPNDCNWNGLCIDKGVCSCYPGYRGPACETDCGCGGHGDCAADGAGCNCDAGWRAAPGGGCEPECEGCADGAGCVAPGECGCAPECLYGTCYNGRCECWAGYGSAACDTLVGGAPNAGSPVGMNVGGVSYWTTQWVFTDVMKQSNVWWTQNQKDMSPTNPWTTGVNLTLSGDGYPLFLPTSPVPQVAHKLTVRDVQLHAMPGRYVALYDGEGTLELGFDAKVASVSKGRVEFDFAPTSNPACAATGAAYCGDNGIWLRLTATNTANPLRNVRLFMPGFDALEGRQVFHPWFIKALERYSVLRFMDLMSTNSDTIPPWADRTKTTHDTQARPGGMAIEHIIDLCNVLGAAPWINVHHTADDGYVRSLATLIRNRLRPDVRVFVEHSNEVWNTAFPQGKYAQQEGLRLGLAADKATAGYLYHGMRSEQIFDIFSDVFGAPARAARLKFVVGSWGFVCNGAQQQCGPPAARATLGYGSVAAKADVLAVAPYFDCGLGVNPTLDAQTSIDDLLAKCNPASMNVTRYMISVMRGVAESFNLTLGTYEAGPSIMEPSVIFNGGGTAGAAEKYIALQRDPRFEAVLTSYLEMYEAAGLANVSSSPLMYFSSAGVPSKYGSWGLIEYTGQDPSTAPKHRAMMSFIDARASPPADCLDLANGLRGLADTSYAGMPAIMAPRKGGVWVLGVAYNITWPRWHAPKDPTVNIALFKATDCAGATPLFAVAGASPVTPPAGPGYDYTYVTVTLPEDDSLLGDNMFFRLEGTGTGQRNYSEVFAVQRKAVQSASPDGCVTNPRLPAAQPPAAPPRHCRPELRWNLTKLSTGWCEFDVNGCRTYRTSRTPGAWSSSFKPVYDCTALYSPDPGVPTLLAANATVGPLIPGAPSGGC